MLTRDSVIRFTLDAILLASLSVLLLIMGMLFTNSAETSRVQDEYSSRFAGVLQADYYEKIETELADGYEGITGVYEAKNANGTPSGFVIEVEVKDHDSGNPLKLLVGVNYNTAELTGLMRAPDDDSASTITDSDISQILLQTVGRQIPVSYADGEGEDDPLLNSATKLEGLNDGTYYAQTLEADDSGYIDYVEMVIEDGYITSVQWNAFNTDMNIRSRRDSALSGVYSVSGLNWATQSYNLCHALMDVQDPQLLAMKSDGTTDIVDGVTVNIRTFYNLCLECIENSRAGFDKEDYFEGLAQVIENLFSGTPGDLGIVNDDGFIVYSFEDYPSLFVGEDAESGTAVNMNLRQKVTGDMTDYSPEDDEENVGDEQGESNISEDGIRSESSSLNGEAIDGIPSSEIKTYIDGITGRASQTADIVTGINTAYKFLKDYLNWMA